MKRRSLFYFAIVMAIVISACSGPVSPADTVKPPRIAAGTAVNGENFMEEFNRLKNANRSPSELLDFIKPKIGNLEVEEADSALKTLIEMQELQIVNYREKLLAEDFNSRINSYNYEDLVAMKDIKDNDVKDFLQNAYSNGYKLATSEGKMYLKVDYTQLITLFSQFVSEEVSDYLDIKAEECDKPYAKDAAIFITLDELAARIVATESFIGKYTDSMLIKDIKALHSNYLEAYLIGLNNTPAFNYEDNMMDFRVLENFKNSISKYPDSKLSKVLVEYIAIIEKSDGKKNQDILNFVSSAAKV